MDVKKKKRIRRESYRSKYCTFQCQTEPILQDWVAWDKLAIDQISYCNEDSNYRVVVRSHASKGAKTWTSFMALLNGFNMEKRAFHKHQCPERMFIKGDDIKVIQVYLLYLYFLFCI